MFFTKNPYRDNNKVLKDDETRTHQIMIGITLAVLIAFIFISIYI